MPKTMSAGAGGGGGRERGRRVTSSLSEINVIPLVDVMLVLLIIFMVAAPMLQRGMEINLPVAARSQEIAAQRMFVELPASYRKDKLVYLEKEGIRLSVLAARLKEKTAGAEDTQVFVRSDGSLQVQDLIDVLGELKAAGIQTAGIVTKQPGE